MLIWLFVSGGLISCHETQVYVRSNRSLPRITQDIIRLAYIGLGHFAYDCRSFPTEQQGLRALVVNPGITNWAGPYLPSEWTRDAWGHNLQYKINAGQPHVWSLGEDGLNGTEDDLNGMYTEIKIEPMFLKNDKPATQP